MIRTVMKGIVLLMTGGILTGCSVLPRVVADSTESLPSRSADHVMIYEEDTSVPVEAKPIGTVKVTDGGMTPVYKCLYGNMLALAVKQTAACGGNALHIDKHKKPSIPFGSNCHRIWGTMYLMPDSMVDADTPSVLQQLEEKNDAELLSMQKKYIHRSEQMFRSQRNIFKVGGGLAWVTGTVPCHLDNPLIVKPPIMPRQANGWFRYLSFLFLNEADAASRFYVGRLCL